MYKMSKNKCPIFLDYYKKVSVKQSIKNFKIKLRNILNHKGNCQLYSQQIKIMKMSHKFMNFLTKSKNNNSVKTNFIMINKFKQNNLNSFRLRL